MCARLNWPLACLWVHIETCHIVIIVVVVISFDLGISYIYLIYY